MHILRLLVAIAVAFNGAPARAQQATAEEIARMLVIDLSPTGAMESGQWFTDSALSGSVTRGLGVIYVHIPGSAGSVSIHAGLYGHSAAGWRREREVTGLFGYSPRDAAFFPGRVEVTTTTLAPGDPRCCPSLPVRWSIDLETGQAAALR
jgi:hypothetical protein